MFWYHLASSPNPWHPSLFFMLFFPLSYRLMEIKRHLCWLITCYNSSVSQGPPDHLPSSVFHWDSQDLAYSHTLDLLHQKRPKAKSAKEKEPGVKSEGNQTQASWRPLPVASCRTCMLLWTISCNNTCKTVSAGEAPRYLAPWFLLAVAHRSCHCLAHPRIPESWKEGRCSAQTVLFEQTV